MRCREDFPAWVLRPHRVRERLCYLQNAVVLAGLLEQTRIKNYSNWPTIPQVYLNGEFVGGCDILLQMHQNGDLVEELKKLGIRSALLDAEKDQDKK
ncbi:PREDICTED: glutaredoxin-related protein 5, mitochondrial [Chaetura pelagica]|uniref:glutaredoxin-related protein 5, mitochondrial n=1 Tax=Chaetura pelagica TaxID=8897 RepID=UPI00052383F5|nr:PREDICTED: glutaredoxin-related protein 5, mitochondrial [Chaetura pelagica]